MNRYVLAKIDTGTGSSNPHGLHPGNMIPWTSGLFAADTIQQLIADNGDYEPSNVHNLLALYQPSPSKCCPDSMACSAEYGSGFGESGPMRIADIDRDGREEVLFTSCTADTIFIYSVKGYDSLRPFCYLPTYSLYGLAIGDFDGDSLMEFATADPSGSPVSIYKCLGWDSCLLWEDVPANGCNSSDVFAGANVDGTHRPVFFVSSWTSDGWAWLDEYAPTQGTHGYEAHLVDSVQFSTDEVNAQSICGDIDGDGTDEVIWSTGEQIRVYEWTAPHQYQLVWTWSQPGNNSCNVNLYDMNGTGYKQILESGSGCTHIFEIEAIKVLTPNGGEAYRSGDTCRITWETFNPPRCDSVSLFLRTDSAWQLDTIVHGLPPSDTTYLWQIPPGLCSDYCHVVAIAYGPGWQYDESDTFFTIQPLGVEESEVHPIPETKLVGVFPNPMTDHAVVSFQLSKREPVSLRLYDISGRIVAALANGTMNAGRYNLPLDIRHSDFDIASGIYFLRFDAATCDETCKLMLTR
jgi:hypothetical protein